MIPKGLTGNFKANARVRASRISKLRPLLAVLGTPAAVALVALDDLQHHPAWQQARQQADELVSDARDHHALARHEAVIAGLCDLLGGAGKERRGLPAL